MCFRIIQGLVGQWDYWGSYRCIDCRNIRMPNHSEIWKVCVAPGSANLTWDSQHYSHAKVSSLSSELLAPAEPRCPYTQHSGSFAWFFRPWDKLAQNSKTFSNTEHYFQEMSGMVKGMGINISLDLLLCSSEYTIWMILEITNRLLRLAETNNAREYSVQRLDPGR